VGSKDVQFRLGKTIITTPEWLTSHDNRQRDVAFIQLERPFEGNLRIFKFEDTPAQGHVVPGDKTHDTRYWDERGGEMYEMFTNQEYSLHSASNPNALGLLEYDVATWGGKSLPPILTPSHLLTPHRSARLPRDPQRRQLHGRYRHPRARRRNQKASQHHQLLHQQLQNDVLGLRH